MSTNKVKSVPDGYTGILVIIPQAVTKQLDQEIAIMQGARSHSRAAYLRDLLYSVLGVENPTAGRILSQVPAPEYYARLDLSTSRPDTRKACELYIRGYNLSEIQRTFDEEKVPTRRNGDQWYHNSIRNLLLEALKYTGIVDVYKKPSILTPPPAPAPLVPAPRVAKKSSVLRAVRGQRLNLKKKT